VPVVDFDQATRAFSIGLHAGTDPADVESTVAELMLLGGVSPSLPLEQLNRIGLLLAAAHSVAYALALTLATQVGAPVDSIINATLADPDADPTTS
jgi:hypothetical protein